MSKLWDVELTCLDGHKTTLGAYRGNVVLVVNLAKDDGVSTYDFWRELQRLHTRFSPHGFVVLGFPWDQLRPPAQRWGRDHADVRAFAEARGVTFPLFAVADTWGPTAHPLFRALEERIKAGEPLAPNDRAELTNPFVKTLLTRDGKVMQRHYCRVPVRKIEEELEALFDEERKAGVAAQPAG